MKVKSQLYRVLLAAAMLTLLSTFVGCKREKTENPDNKPTPATSTPIVTAEPKGSPTPVEQGDMTPSLKPTSTLDQPSDNPTGALDPDDDDDPDDSLDITPSVGDDDEDDDDPDDPGTPTPEEPTPEDILRTETWNETFLIWLPEFTDGVFTGAQAEETEDIALFTDVDESEVREYIEALKSKGFIHKVETTDDANGIIYDACNTDNWWARVVYSDGEMSVGSGYRAEKTEPGDRLDELWTATLLGLLPRFEEGTMTGNSESGGETFVLFEEVTAEYIRTYIEKLAEAGFTEDVDDGDDDGFIWYSAEDAEGNLCDLTYYDSSVRLSVTQ